MQWAWADALHTVMCQHRMQLRHASCVLKEALPESTHIAGAPVRATDTATVSAYLASVNTTTAVVATAAIVATAAVITDTISSITSAFTPSPSCSVAYYTWCCPTLCCSTASPFVSR